MRLLPTASLAGLIMAAAALAALAQTAPPPPGPPPGGAMMGPMGGRGPRGPAMLFTRFDADGNGRVTAAEAWGFVAARFAEADRDRDGALVLEEAIALRWMPVPPAPPGAGPAEASAPPTGDPRRARMTAGMFRAVDANRDGKVTQEELRPAVEAMVRSLDANGDGGITLDELPGPPMGMHGHGEMRGPGGMHGPMGGPPPPR